MSSEPAAKCLPSASKDFSATWMVAPLEFVDQRQERNLAGVGHGKHRSGAGDLAGERCRIVKRASSST